MSGSGIYIFPKAFCHVISVLNLNVVLTISERIVLEVKIRCAYAVSSLIDGSAWSIMHELVNAVFLEQSLFATTMI